MRHQTIYRDQYFSLLIYIHRAKVGEIPHQRKHCNMEVKTKMQRNMTMHLLRQHTKEFKHSAGQQSTSTVSVIVNAIYKKGVTKSYLNIIPICLLIKEINLQKPLMSSDYEHRTVITVHHVFQRQNNTYLAKQILQHVLTTCSTVPSCISTLLDVITVSRHCNIYIYVVACNSQQHNSTGLYYNHIHIIILLSSLWFKYIIYLLSKQILYLLVIHHYLYIIVYLKDIH